MPLTKGEGWNDGFRGGSDSASEDEDEDDLMEGGRGRPHTIAGYDAREIDLDSRQDNVKIVESSYVLAQLQKSRQESSSTPLNIPEIAFAPVKPSHKPISRSSKIQVYVKPDSKGSIPVAYPDPGRRNDTAKAATKKPANSTTTSKKNKTGNDEPTQLVQTKITDKRKTRPKAADLKVRSNGWYGTGRKPMAAPLKPPKTLLEKVDDESAAIAKKKAAASKRKAKASGQVEEDQGKITFSRIPPGASANSDYPIVKGINKLKDLPTKAKQPKPPRSPKQTKLKPTVIPKVARITRADLLSSDSESGSNDSSFSISKLIKGAKDKKQLEANDECSPPRVGSIAPQATVSVTSLNKKNSKLFRPSLPLVIKEKEQPSNPAKKEHLAEKNASKLQAIKQRTDDHLRGRIMQFRAIPEYEAIESRRASTQPPSMYRSIPTTASDDVITPHTQAVNDQDMDYYENTEPSTITHLSDSLPPFNPELYPHSSSASSQLPYSSPLVPRSQALDRQPLLGISGPKAIPYDEAGPAVIDRFEALAADYARGPIIQPRQAANRDYGELYDQGGTRSHAFANDQYYPIDDGYRAAAAPVQSPLHAYHLPYAHQARTYPPSEDDQEVWSTLRPSKKARQSYASNERFVSQAKTSSGFTLPGLLFSNDSSPSAGITTKRSLFKPSAPQNGLLPLQSTSAPQRASQATQRNNHSAQDTYRHAIATVGQPSDAMTSADPTPDWRDKWKKPATNKLDKFAMKHEVVGSSGSVRDGGAFDRFW